MVRAGTAWNRATCSAAGRRIGSSNMPANEAEAAVPAVGWSTTD